MKEIKAYISQHRISDVLQALRDSGLCNPSADTGCHSLTIAKVQHPLVSTDPSQQRYSMELAEPVVAEFKLELVAADELVDSVVTVIANAARTGRPEAGWVFVSDVERGVKIC